MMRVHICTIVDEISARRSVGVGTTQQRALDDALLHFPDLTARRTEKTIRNRADFYFEVRPLK
jgi:hypothetical protein